MAKKVTKTRIQLLEEALQELINELSLTDIDPVSKNEVPMEVPENASEAQLELKILDILNAKDDDDGLPIIRPEDKFSDGTEKIIAELKESLAAPAKKTPPAKNQKAAEKAVNLPPYDKEDIIEDIEVAEELSELVAIANKYEEFGNMVGYIGSYKKFEILKEAMLMELEKRQNIKPTDPPPTVKETAKPVKERSAKKEKSVKEPDLSETEDTVYFEISINPKFKAACPELTPEEFKALEELILKDGKILTPGITWQGQLVDGHNRYEIAKKHNLEFPLIEKDFADENAVILWIKENAIAQRNLTDFQKYELAKEIEEILVGTGKKKQATKAGGKITRVPNKEDEKHNTRDELSKKIGVSSRQIAKAKVIEKEAPEEVKDEVRKGTKSLNKAYDEVTKDKPKKITKNSDLKLYNASRELRLWVTKYQKEPLVEEFIDSIVDVIGSIDEKIKDLKK